MNSISPDVLQHKLGLTLHMVIIAGMVDSFFVQGILSRPRRLQLWYHTLRTLGQTTADKEHLLILKVILSELYYIRRNIHISPSNHFLSSLLRSL